MGLSTRFTELVGIEHPIVQGGMIWAGQVQALIHDIPTCQSLISRIICEAKAIIENRLAKMLSTSLST